MRGCGIWLLVLGLSLAAQTRVLEQVRAGPGLVGVVRFEAQIEGEPRGSFVQVVSEDSLGLRVSEELVLRYGEDQSQDQTETWLDEHLRLRHRKRQVGPRLTEWRLEGELMLRETSFPAFSEAKNLQEFDRPQTDVLYGFGHFLLVLRCLPVEALDGKSFAKLERDGPITVFVRVLEDGRIEYRETYDDGGEQRMWIERDEQGMVWRITSPELVFDFVRVVGD